MESLTDLYPLVKMFVIAVFMWGVAASTTGCGVRSGATVIGTTGFLEAVNQGRQVELTRGKVDDQRS